MKKIIAIIAPTTIAAIIAIIAIAAIEALAEIYCPVQWTQVSRHDYRCIGSEGEFMYTLVGDLGTECPQNSRCVVFKGIYQVPESVKTIWRCGRLTAKFQYGEDTTYWATAVIDNNPVLELDSAVATDSLPKEFLDSWNELLDKHCGNIR